MPAQPAEHKMRYTVRDERLDPGNPCKNQNAVNLDFTLATCCPAFYDEDQQPSRMPQESEVTA